MRTILLVQLSFFRKPGQYNASTIMARVVYVPMIFLTDYVLKTSFLVCGNNIKGAFRDGKVSYNNMHMIIIILSIQNCSLSFRSSFTAVAAI